MEYQVVTVSAVMQGLEKESVFVTRVRKNHTEPTVRDNRLQSIFYKAESSFEKKKKNVHLNLKDLLQGKKSNWNRQPAD